MKRLTIVHHGLATIQARVLQKRCTTSTSATAGASRTSPRAPTSHSCVSSSSPAAPRCVPSMPTPPPYTNQTCGRKFKHCESLPWARQVRDADVDRLVGALHSLVFLNLAGCGNVCLNSNHFQLFPPGDEWYFTSSSDSVGDPSILQPT
jgi:hypothetical protein